MIIFFVFANIYINHQTPLGSSIIIFSLLSSTALFGCPCPLKMTRLHNVSTGLWGRICRRSLDGVVMSLGCRHSEMKINSGMHNSGRARSRAPTAVAQEPNPYPKLKVLTCASLYTSVNPQMNGVMNNQKYFSQGNGAYPIMSSILS